MHLLYRIKHQRSVLIVPDKDADGLSAGTLMYKTLRHLGLSPDSIKVHHLSKGANVHSDEERQRMEAFHTERSIVLDQGSRPGPPLLTSKGGEKRVLIIDHHMSTEFPRDAVILTACQTLPIATAALLTYVLLRRLWPDLDRVEGWRAIVGVVGDLGTTVAKWGRPPWPAELQEVVKQVGAKNVSDAVASINAPRRTADYNVPKAWDIYLHASHPSEVSRNAFFKLCRLEVKAETERWARTPPSFSLDARVAVITIHTGYQVHPVIATRWAGTLGRKSKKLLMCANTGFNPDPDKVSFSCRIAGSLRGLSENEKPDLISLLVEYGNAIPGFSDGVGADFARGHKEATGGVIPKV
ncbi:DHH phosphoesterase [Naematelia encephala]|uniref:DHH phosphoesterase n=1 Tax=Naematelia encephala TaxID=71784 RepID=A0A1Y2BHH5_9TREE|nr:DHH phosphoesterase [Naematelia encephala]